MVLYSSHFKKFDSIAEKIFTTFQSKGHQTEKIKVEEPARVSSLFPYDLVLVGSPVKGFWGGKFSEKLQSFIERSKGLQGKKSAVFVYPKPIRTGKAIKLIMHSLERKGSIVIDFRRIKNKTEAKSFAEKLGKNKKINTQ